MKNFKFSERDLQLIQEASDALDKLSPQQRADLFAAMIPVAIARARRFLVVGLVSEINNSETAFPVGDL